MRAKNSSYNVIVNIIQLIFTTILSFAARTFFINILGKEILGLDGLFTNILSMLSLAELGIGTAISYNLYSSLANSDDNKISALMSMYRRIYQIVGISIFAVGMLLMPFLHLLINGYSFENLYLIYFLYVLGSATTYFVSYKEILINADQKNYKLFVIKSIFIFILYILQILFLVYTKNFIAFLIITITIKFIQNLVINIYVGRKYKHINFKSKEKIDGETKKSIVVNVKSLFVSKIGDYLLNGTDNIIISIINIGLTGIYSNYLSIVGIMKTIISCIFNGLTASFGNLVALETKETQENVFDITNFLYFVVSGLITIELIFLFNPFVTIWIGKKYLVDFWIVIVISLNFYFYSQMSSIDIIKSASGMYSIDKWIAIIQAIVNLVISIILGQILGLGGVLLGTLISYILVAIISKPYLIYKHIFNKKPYKYFVVQFKNIIAMGIVIIISSIIFNLLKFNIGFVNIILMALIISAIFLIILIIMFRNDKEFKYFYNLILKKIKRI